MSVTMKYDITKPIFEGKEAYFMSQEGFCVKNINSIIKNTCLESARMWMETAWILLMLKLMKLLTILQQLQGVQLKLVHQNNGTHKAEAPGYEQKTNMEKKVSK